MVASEMWKILTNSIVVEIKEGQNVSVLHKFPTKLKIVNLALYETEPKDHEIPIKDLSVFANFAYKFGVRLPVVACTIDLSYNYPRQLFELSPFLLMLNGEANEYLKSMIGKKIAEFAYLNIHASRSFVSDHELQMANDAARIYLQLWKNRQFVPDIKVTDIIEFAHDEPRKWLYRRLGIEDMVYRLHKQQSVLLLQNRSLLNKICDLIESDYLITDFESQTRLADLRLASSVNVKTAPFYTTLLGRFAALEDNRVVVSKSNSTFVPVTTLSRTVTEHDEVLTVLDDGTVEFAPVRRTHTKLCAYLSAKGLRDNRVKGNYFEDEAEELAKYFELPNIPTVAEIAKDKMQLAYETIDWIEQVFCEKTNQRLLDFQREDLARLLVKGSGILAWDPGCGKTVAGLFFVLGTIMMGKAKPRALIVTPQDLVLQWFREMKKFFGEEFASEWIVIDSIERAIALCNLARKIPKNIPLYAITWYEVLRQSIGVDKPLERRPYHPCPICKQLIDEKGRCSVGCPHDGAKYLSRSRDAGFFLKDFVKGGVLVIDEATHIKSVDSQRGIAARRLVTAACRLLLTGTPIKNLLSDLPMLLQLAAKPNSEAYPFPAEDTHRFSKQFMVVEQNLLTGRKRVGPEPTNIAVAQKMLSGIILRRTKDQTGEDIVPLKVEIQTVPLTSSQAAWYKAWCDDEVFERWFESVHDKPIHPLAKVLSRMSHLLFVIGHPTSDTATGRPVPLSRFADLPMASESTYKNRLTVELAIDFAKQKNHVVLFAQTVGVIPLLAEQIKARGVPVHMAVHVNRNGKAQSLSPLKRAMVIKQFEQSGGVLLASVSAMSHGHDLAFVSRAIIHSLCFAYDNYAQAIMRVHRIISPEPVEVHVICCDKTLDVYLLSLLQRKEQAAKSLLENAILERSVGITPDEWKKLWEQVKESANEL